MPDVIVRRQDAVFEIILNRPEMRNALNREAIGELAAAVAEAAEDRTARAVCCAAPAAIFARAATLRCLVGS